MLITNALILLSGCRSPEPAPEALDPLVSFLFERLEAEDTEELSDGLDNLSAHLGSPSSRPPSLTTPTPPQRRWGEHHVAEL